MNAAKWRGHGRAAVVAALAVAASLGAGCGKKGPPLAPLLRVPAQVADLTARRVDEQVHLRFTVPAENVEGERPADLAAVEVYAITATRAPLVTDAEDGDLRAIATLVAREPVLPPLPDGAPVTPGLVQGGPALIRETLTPEARVPATLGGDVRDEDDEVVARPVVAPGVGGELRRYYFVVGVNGRGRPGPPSVLVEAPLAPVSGAPSAPVVTYTATALTLAWTRPADARGASPVEPGWLPSRPLQPEPPPTRYNVYQVTDEASAGASAPLNAEPLAEPVFTREGVTFGEPQCFVVRAVDVLAGLDVEGPASPATCETPRDTFPPAAPAALAAVGGAGAISLIWEPVSEPDLAGYLVLRGLAGVGGEGDRLESLTPSPIRENTYRDTTAQPGVRYVYAVLAVDTAGNASARSNRVEEAVQP